VLDPFNGSGTTAVAAVSRGHAYVGIDLDEQYLSLTRRRLEALEAAGAERVGAVTGTRAPRTVAAGRGPARKLRSVPAAAGL